MGDLACRETWVDRTVVAISAESDNRTLRYQPVVMSIVPVVPIRAAEGEERMLQVRTQWQHRRPTKVNRIIEFPINHRTTTSNNSREINSSSNPSSNSLSNNLKRTTSSNPAEVKTPPC